MPSPTGNEGGISNEFERCKNPRSAPEDEPTPGFLQRALIKVSASAQQKNSAIARGIRVRARRR